MQCVRVDPGGPLSKVRLYQRDAHAHLGGSLTMVGAIDDLHVFVVALREPPAQAALNTACRDERYFDVPVHGPVLFVATNQEGEEIDVDYDALRERLDVRMPEHSGIEG